MSRLDHEESPAWGKGIDYFEIAKGLARDHAAYLPQGHAEVMCGICDTWVDALDASKILDSVACSSCFQTIQDDLHETSEDIE